MGRVVVTGIGVICPLGNSTEAAFGNAVAGRSAIRRLATAWSGRLDAPLAARVELDAEEHFEPPKLRMLDRVSQFALIAARQAVSQATLDMTRLDTQRCGIFMGCAQGGSLANDEGYLALYGEGQNRLKPFTVLMSMANAPASWIGIEYGIRGPNLTYSTACSSSAVAIGEAWQRLRRGELDLAITGGAEAPLAFGALKAWEALRTLASEDPTDPARSCKPFARDRTGMVLGEGAAILVLEDWQHALARGAQIQGELIGYGVTTDAGHITRPSVEGQAAAMRAALHSAECPAGSIDAINAHGTGTQANDGVETAALKMIFGAHAYRIPVSATKAIHGHLLGASGALELALSLLGMQRSIVLPTMHLEHPAADCDLDYVPEFARYGVRVETLMSSSFAFGGTNATLIVRTPH